MKSNKMQMSSIKENEITTIRSSILPALMRRTLWSGSLLGGVGALSLLMGGIFISLPEMKIWGPFLFIFSLAMITLGLLPYRRLKRLEENPYVLTIEGEGWIHFSGKGKLLFSIPISFLDCITYLEKQNAYGIRVFLKHPLPEKMSVHPEFNLADLHKRSLYLYQCDLFFSYFSQRSFATLQEHLRGSEQ